MGEIKTNDLQEVKNPDIDNYQRIRPESGMKALDARNAWDSIFNNEMEKNKYENTGEDREDKTKENDKEASTQWDENAESQEIRDEIDKTDIGRSDEEIGLLKKLLSEELDGPVGTNYYTSGGSTIWMEIKNGNPVRYKQGPGGKFFDGKENIKFEGKRTVLEKWETDDEKLAFLQKYGWLMEDKEVKSYSAKFKPEY